MTLVARQGMAVVFTYNIWHQWMYFINSRVIIKVYRRGKVQLQCLSTFLREASLFCAQQSRPRFYCRMIQFGEQMFFLYFKFHFNTIQICLSIITALQYMGTPPACIFSSWPIFQRVIYTGECRSLSSSSIEIIVGQISFRKSDENYYLI